MKSFFTLLKLITTISIPNFKRRTFISEYESLIKSLTKFKDLRITFLKNSPSIQTIAINPELKFEDQNFHVAQIIISEKILKISIKIKKFIVYFKGYQTTNMLLIFLLDILKHDLNVLQNNIREMYLHVQHIEFLISFRKGINIRTRLENQPTNVLEEKLRMVINDLIFSLSPIEANYEILLTLLKNEYTNPYKESDLEDIKQNLINDRINEHISKRKRLLNAIKSFMSKRNLKKLNYYTFEKLYSIEIKLRAATIENIGICKNTTKQYIPPNEKLLSQICKESNKKIPLKKKFFLRFMVNKICDLQNDCFQAVKLFYKLNKLRKEFEFIKCLFNTTSHSKEKVYEEDTEIKQNRMYLYARIDVISLEYMKSVIDLYWIVCLKIPSLQSFYIIIKNVFKNRINDEDFQRLELTLNITIKCVNNLLTRSFNQIFNLNNIPLESWCVNETKIQEEINQTKQQILNFN